VKNLSVSKKVKASTRFLREKLKKPPEKKIEKPKDQITFTLSEAEIGKLDKLAETKGISRSELLRRLVRDVT